MSVSKLHPVTRDQYNEIFEQERTVAYHGVDSLEGHLGYRIDSTRLESAARVLACPYKVNPPNWQHGRVIYTVLRAHLSDLQGEVTLLDIGTAKGFSALCMQWALNDSPNVTGHVISVDVLDPNERVRRNTVAELDGFKTLHEILAPWPEAKDITFLQSTGIHWLSENNDHLDFVFVDGKHKYDVVRLEAELISRRQLRGDYCMFDDIQIPGIEKAVSEIRGYDTLLTTYITSNRVNVLLERSDRFAKGN